MRTSGYIPLELGTVYADIYGFDLTKEEVDQLEKIYLMLQEGNMEYVVKSVTETKDLVLLARRSVPSLALADTDPVAKDAGYKVIRLANDRYYLKFFPKKNEVPYLSAIAMMPNSDGKKHVCASVEELQQHFVEDELPTISQRRGHLEKAEVEMLYWLGGKLSEFSSKKFSKTPFEKVPEYVKYIIDVLQLPDDRRVAIYVEPARGYYSTYSDGSSSFRIKTYVTTPDHASYNWTDPKRYFSHIDKNTGHGKVYYADAHPIFPDEKEISKYIRGQKVVGLENPTLELIQRRAQRKAVEDASMSEAQKKLRTRLETKIQELDEKDGEFSFNDVTFRRNELEYEGQILSATGVKMKMLISRFLHNLNDEYFNFERIFEEFLKQIISDSAKDGIINAKLGEVSAEVKTVTKTSQNGATLTNTYINDYRINRDELTPVLERALCYASTDDFNNYLESVSKCSLRFHRLIASGIKVDVRDDILGTKLQFKISLEREKNRNYISFGAGKRYKVSDTNRLLTILNASDMMRVVNLLLDPDIVGVSGKDIREIIESGKEALEFERKKEIEMLDTAIKMFNCEKAEETLLDNGRCISGYIVKGKLREYIIDTEKLRVFEYPSGKYLCMVDKGQNELANTPRLVSRIFALANDSKLAHEITTLAK